jgi:hydrogenase expression/formation protein HypE
MPRTNEPVLPPLGKIDAAFFDRVIFPRLGRADPSVIVGPRHGVDAGVIRLGGGQVMAVTTDPFYVVPTYGWAKAGWFAVHIVASDLATTALRPRFMAIDLNLPPAMTEADLEQLWAAVHDACDRLGINVVTGHTGRYEGCEFPMIGGCTLVGLGGEGDWVAGGMSRPGDAVILTKSAAIEAAGLMAATFPDGVAAALGAELCERAQGLFWQMTTVEDALVAASVGVRDRGVTAMHDATECGVLGGLWELARAANVGLRVALDEVPLADDVAAICRLFEMDPYTAISEGTLLITCVPGAARDVIAALRDHGIAAARVGECRADPRIVVERGGRETELEHPRVDPFWPAFARAAAAR